MFEQLAVDFPAIPSFRRRLAQSHAVLGLILNEAGRVREAEAAYRAAVAVQKKLVVDFPTSRDYRRALAAIHSDLATLLTGLGQWAEAEVAYREVLTVREQLAADFPTVAEYRQGVIQTRENLALLFARLGPASEAVALTEKLVGDPAVSIETLYNGACTFAQVSAASNNPDADAHAARAVELLGRAVAKGYRDIPHLLADADLAPLRRRDDYADLLWGLAEVATPAKR
jgi:tetratricopeptide (TPR) repeat protein